MKCDVSDYSYIVIYLENQNIQERHSMEYVGWVENAYNEAYYVLGGMRVIVDRWTDR